MEKSIKRQINEVIDVVDFEQFCKIRKNNIQITEPERIVVTKKFEKITINFDQQLEEQRQCNTPTSDSLDKLAQEIEEFLQTNIATKMKKMSISASKYKIENNKIDDNFEFDINRIQDLVEDTKSIAEIKLSRKGGRRRRTYAVCCYDDSAATENEIGENIK